MAILTPAGLARQSRIIAAIAFRERQAALDVGAKVENGEIRFKDDAQYQAFCKRVVKNWRSDNPDVAACWSSAQSTPQPADAEGAGPTT